MKTFETDPKIGIWLQQLGQSKGFRRPPLRIVGINYWRDPVWICPVIAIGSSDLLLSAPATYNRSGLLTYPTLLKDLYDITDKRVSDSPASDRVPH